jgi:hypothetical protein
MAVRNRLAILILLGAWAAGGKSAEAKPTIPASAKAATVEGTTPSSAEPASLQRAVSQLLETGATCKPGALAECRRQHERLKKLPGYDAWSGYAFSLVLIQHRSFDDAIAALDDVLASQPDFLPALRAKIWVEMALRKHRAAVDDMRAAAALIADQAAAAPATADAEDQHATAYLLGRAFGFLEAERTGTMSTSDLRRSKQKVLSKLGELRSPFDQGEESFSADLSKAAAEVNEAEVAAAVEREQAEQALKLRQTEVDKAGAKVEYETEKLKTQVKRDLDELGKEAESLQTELLKGQFSLNTVDEAIAIHQRQLIVLRRRSAADVARTSNGLGRLMTQRAVIERQMAALNFRLSDVAVRTDTLLGQGSQDVGELEAKSGQLQHAGKKLQYAEKQRPKNKPSENQQSRALRQKMQSFRSYEPFPFEQQRQRVLTALQTD